MGSWKYNLKTASCGILEKICIFLILISEFQEAYYNRARARIKKWESSDGNPSDLLGVLEDAEAALKIESGNKSYRQIVNFLEKELGLKAK